MPSFVNFSNHPSADWNEKQKSAAEKYGEIFDYSFPQVDPRMNSAEISELAAACVEGIMKLSPAAVMCQGEFTLSYTVIHELIKKKIPVVAACSVRNVEYAIGEDGEQKKVVRFEFEQFREYAEL